MPRYFTRPRATRALWVEDEHFSPDPGVLNMPTVSDHEATDTGLLDANGDCIMRAPNPIGFGKDEDW
jgi:hypothetical protein